jgi:hypothetical protein
MIEDTESSCTSPTSSSSTSSSITLPYSLEIRLRSATTKTGFFEKRKRIRTFHVTLYYENQLIYRTVSQRPEWNSLVILPLCNVNNDSQLYFELYMNKYFRVPHLPLPLSLPLLSDSQQPTGSADGITATRPPLPSGNMLSSHHNGKGNSNTDLIGMGVKETEKEENKRNTLLGQRKITVGKLIELSKHYPELTLQLKPAPTRRGLLWSKDQKGVNRKQRRGSQKAGGEESEESDDDNDFPQDDHVLNQPSFLIKNLDTGETMNLKDFSKKVKDTSSHEEATEIHSDEEETDIAAAMTSSARLVISTKLKENILFEIVKNSYELLSFSDVSSLLLTFSHEIQEKYHYFSRYLSFSFNEIFSFYYYYHLFLVSYDIRDNNNNILSLLKLHQKKMPFLLGHSNSSDDIMEDADPSVDHHNSDEELDVYYPHSKLSYHTLYSFHHHYFNWKENEKHQKEYFLNQYSFYEQRIQQENSSLYAQRATMSSLLDPINDDIHSYIVHKPSSSLLFPFPSLTTGGLTIVFLDFRSVEVQQQEQRNHSSIWEEPSSSSSSSVPSTGTSQKRQSEETAAHYETKEIYLTFPSLLQYFTFLGEVSYFFSNDSDSSIGARGENAATANGETMSSITAQMQAKVNVNIERNEWEDCFIFLEKASQTLSISSIGGTNKASGNSNRFYFRAFFHQVSFFGVLCSLFFNSLLFRVFVVLYDCS